MRVKSLQSSRLRAWKLLNSSKKMFKSVRVNLTTLMTLHCHSLSLFLSLEELCSLVASVAVS